MGGEVGFLAPRGGLGGLGQSLAEPVGALAVGPELFFPAESLLRSGPRHKRPGAQSGETGAHVHPALGRPHLGVPLPGPQRLPATAPRCRRFNSDEPRYLYVRGQVSIRYIFQATKASACHNAPAGTLELGTPSSGRELPPRLAAGAAVVAVLRRAGRRRAGQLVR